MWILDASRNVIASKEFGFGNNTARYFPPIDLKAGIHYVRTERHTGLDMLYHISAVPSPDPAAPSDSYAAWAEAFFGPEAPPEQAGPDAVADGGGLTNAAQRALGLNPLAEDTAFQSLAPDAAGGDQLTFEIDLPTEASPGIRYRIEYAESPAGPWQPVAEGRPGESWEGSGIVGESASPEPGRTRVRCAFTPGDPGARGFARAAFLGADQ
ncbi:MAG: hypothetical protein R3F11_22985 [Verrucomicrobiales bacterium]